VNGTIAAREAIARRTISAQAAISAIAAVISIARGGPVARTVTLTRARDASLGFLAGAGIARARSPRTSVSVFLFSHARFPVDDIRVKGFLVALIFFCHRYVLFFQFPA
jgi:hypothetical protein